MIEIIYNESGEKGTAVIVRPPKNIRQIGNPKGRHKIYMEDYVYTYLHSAIFEGESQKRAAILLGKSEISQDIRYTFISGAISCDDFAFQEEGIVFDENCWEYIYKEIKQYFDRQEIVGWFLGTTGFLPELTPMVEAAHRKYFAGRDKLLLLSDPAEHEDIFFAYDQGILQKREGYYVYYEKNLSMQEYMVSTREKAGEQIFRIEEETEETLENSGPAIQETTAAEEAIRNYRAMFNERKQTSFNQKKTTLLYIASTAAMMILCVIGITTVNNYEKMKQVEQALAAISQSENRETEKESEERKEVVVESVPGEVTPNTGQPGNQNETDASAALKPANEAEPASEAEPVRETDPASEAAALARTYLEQGYYMVQPGDKLEVICLNIYQTTAMMDKLCETNKIEDADKIYAGQKLVLP